MRVGNARYLSADLSIACDDDSAQYQQVVAWAWLGIFQVVALPLILLVVMFFALRFRGGWSSERREALAVFYSSYKQEAWYFESIRVMRKTLWAALAQLEAAPRFQLSLLHGLLLFSLLLTAKLSPYVSNSANRQEVFSQSILACCLLIASAYFLGESADSPEAASAGLMIEVLLVVVFTTYLAVLTKLSCCNASDPNWIAVKRRASTLFGGNDMSGSSRTLDGRSSTPTRSASGLELVSEEHFQEAGLAELGNDNALNLPPMSQVEDPRLVELNNLPDAPNVANHSVDHPDGHGAPPMAMPSEQQWGEY